MGMIPISANIHDLFRKLRSCRKWEKGMDINPGDETSYTTQYQEVFLKYVDNEYFDKHQCVSVNEHLSLPRINNIPSGTIPGSCWSFLDIYDLSSDDEEYLMPNNVAGTTPGRSDPAANLSNAARLSLNSPPEAPKNWGQITAHLNDYHSDP